jgi:hypothetical protein
MRDFRADLRFLRVQDCFRLGRIKRDDPHYELTEKWAAIARLGFTASPAEPRIRKRAKAGGRSERVIEHRLSNPRVFISIAA